MIDRKNNPDRRIVIRDGDVVTMADGTEIAVEKVRIECRGRKKLVLRIPEDSIAGFKRKYSGN